MDSSLTPDEGLKDKVGNNGSPSGLNRHFEQALFILAHNLNSPSSNIRSLVKIAQENGLPQEDLIKCLKGIERSVNAISSIITDINNVLITTYGNAEKEKVVLSEMLSPLVSHIAEEKQDPTIHFELDLQTDEVFTIKPYLFSIFQNLIYNSVKYRRPGVDLDIVISTRFASDTLTITYRDNGRGINLNKFGNDMFGLYKRFHPGLDGKGMGLFMVKNQVELLGGTISVKSQVDEGTEFVIGLGIDK